MDKNEATTKKIIFSGIQPSGILTIGNYLGAIRTWNELQHSYDCLFCIVDLHAITVKQDPAELRRRSYQTLAIYMACGIDPTENIIFIQSHVPAHTELSWVLGCSTMFGELSRMTQFKDKSAKHSNNINAGLFTYPVLMASDILLYQTDLVPVGEDQRQHIELTRDIAARFNGVYGDTFKMPEAYIPKIGSRIMSLQDPFSKMSKSDTGDGSVALLDTRDTVMRKFKRAVTDSGHEICCGEGKEGISNLISIYCGFTGKTTDEAVSEFCGRGYGEFKLAVGEVCAEKLSELQDKVNTYMSDKAQLDAVLAEGAQRAAYLARKTLSKVYRKIGLVASGR